MPPRFFKHGELPLVILALVDDTPRHGYDLMAELTRLFGPRYRASPGSIYPAIEALHTEGLIAGQPVAGKVVYSTTALGQQALEERSDMLVALELRKGIQLSAGNTLDELLTRLKVRVSPLAGRIDPTLAAAVLNQAADDLEALTPINNPKRKPHAG